MAAHRKNRFWRLCRIYFRRFRMMIWVLVLLVLGMLIYLNQIGLPGFFKQPLLEKLRARGIDLQFSRLRLRWYQGIVADNVHFGQTQAGPGPQITAAEVEIQLNTTALTHFQLQVDSLAFRQGSITWPVTATNQPDRQLSIQNIQTYLRLLPGDEWRLEELTAGFAGARIALSGSVTNASAIQDWQIFHAAGPSPAGLWENRLRRLADVLEQIHFSAPPELRLDVRGDARDLPSFRVRLVVNSPGADTPWGSVNQGRLKVRLSPGTTGEVSHAQIILAAAAAQTPTVAITNLQLNLELISPRAETNVIKGNCVASASSVQTKWANASPARFTAQWAHALTNPIPYEGRGEFECDNGKTEWGSAGHIRLAAQLLNHPEAAPKADASWAWWSKLEPYALDWQLGLRQLDAQGLAVPQLDCAGRWRAPELMLSNLQAELYDGSIKVGAQLDVATRALRTDITSTVDPHKLYSVLTEGARRFLDQFDWAKPPVAMGQLYLVLPSWTNRAPDWRAEVQPTLRIEGHFDVAHGGSFRGVTADSAASDLSYSNMVWTLPNLIAIRPEGRIEAANTSDDRSKAYYWRLSSTIDPQALKPLLATNVQRAMDLFTFRQSPVVEAEIWGRWHDDDRIGLKGRVALTNFTFRGESADGFQSEIQYTNALFRLTRAELQRGAQRARADGLTADLEAKKLFLTNGFSTTEPMVVARAIGPHVVRAIEPYIFSNPPTAHVHGTIPLDREEDADLYFQLEGGPFHWWKFNSRYVTGEVHWAGESLDLTGVRAEFYGGSLVGSAAFDFSAPRGTDYHFSIAATKTILEFLMKDLSPRTNHLEGLLSGNLVIKRANTSLAGNCDGHGDVALRDGLIWAIPIFGVFSEPLDALVPGLGNSRASSGSGTFAITNGVIWSDDLEIRAPAMRLQYRGAVDLEGKVNATVEAQLLRDMWLVGPIVSSVFWPFTKMFEYRMTGELTQPKIEPRYFGKLPLHPFRGSKEPEFPDIITPPPSPPSAAP